jgi:hypothetical protein
VVTEEWNSVHPYRREELVVEPLLIPKLFIAPCPESFPHVTVSWRKTYPRIDQRRSSRSLRISQARPLRLEELTHVNPHFRKEQVIEA